MIGGKQVLVVDDERSVRFFLERTLRLSGYVVETASGGEEALKMLRDTFFDVVLLDLRLGGAIDGLQVLQGIRWRWPETVVIILTGHASLESAMTAIQKGVEGYLQKPVEPEQVRRIVEEAMTRRQRYVKAAGELSEEDKVRAGPFVLDEEKGVITQEGELVDLTPAEYKLMVHMIRHPGKVVSPGEMVLVARGYASTSRDEARNLVKWYVHGLRSKVEEDSSNPRYIVNVRGRGYKLEIDETEGA
jgi:DNA-binding response OmpR family regulator